MNLVDLIFILGFMESLILFLYAIRWYIFSFVSLKSGPVDNSDEKILDVNSSFVSVLLPTYNEPKVVDRLLSACTSFNLDSFEVIVIDDSNDGVTTEKLEVWSKHPKVKVIHRNSQEGWKGGALNVGLVSKA
ncbi:MAG: glycosyltransferase [Candidatus Bathyarchaeota archaeon]